LLQTGEGTVGVLACGRCPLVFRLQNDARLAFSNEVPLGKSFGWQALAGGTRGGRCWMRGGGVLGALASCGQEQAAMWGKHG